VYCFQITVGILFLLTALAFAGIALSGVGGPPTITSLSPALYFVICALGCFSGRFGRLCRGLAMLGLSLFGLSCIVDQRYNAPLSLGYYRDSPSHIFSGVSYVVCSIAGLCFCLPLGYFAFIMIFTKGEDIYIDSHSKEIIMTCQVPHPDVDSVTEDDYEWFVEEIGSKIEQSLVEHGCEIDEEAWDDDALFDITFKYKSNSCALTFNEFTENQWRVTFSCYEEEYSKNKEPDEDLKALVDSALREPASVIEISWEENKESSTPESPQNGVNVRHS